jgi:prepilin-type N-terminal cleavage/methylation domain-containing protein
LQLPPPDAILGSVNKAFEECNPIKCFQDKNDTKRFKIKQNVKHVQNKVLKTNTKIILETNTKTHSKQNLKAQHLQNKLLTRNSKAFTLAEVLITLVIIGIIAAITVPTIITNAQERERSARVKKVYATLSNAMTRVKAAGGDMDFEVQDSDNDSIKQWFDTYLKPNLITSRICYNSSACWGNERMKYMNGTVKGYGGNIITTILNDGTLLDFDVWGWGGATVSEFGIKKSNDNLYYYLTIFADINGRKEPNTFGKDIFVFVWVPYIGLMPAYKDKTEAQRNADCSKTGTGYGCIYKYLKT